MKLKDIDGKFVVITGGSSGIGFSIAQRLAEQGARILLVARNEKKLRDAAAKLNNIAEHNVKIISVDVSQPTDVERLKYTVQKEAGCADIIINSAGIVSAGLLDEVPMAEWDRLHNINVRGLVQVLQALIPDMKKAHQNDQKDRHIINIASAAGIISFPGMSAYSATKAAVIALTDCLRIELAPLKIGVTSVCPGFVQTPISDTIQLFGKMEHPKTRKRVEAMFHSGGLTPEMVANKTLEALVKNKGNIVVGREVRIASVLKRISAPFVTKIIARSLPSYN